MKIKMLLLFLLLSLFTHGTMSAQSVTGKKMERTGKDIEETTKTLKKGEELIKGIFGKKDKKVGKKRESTSLSELESQLPSETVATENPEGGGTAQSMVKDENDLKTGVVHPEAVVLDVDRLGNFNDGVAIVNKGMSTALIDSKGKYVVPFNKYNFIGQLTLEGLQNGIFYVTNHNATPGKEHFNGFINSSGSPIPFTTGKYFGGNHLGQYLIVRDGTGTNRNISHFYDKTGKEFYITGYAERPGSISSAYSKGCQQGSKLFRFLGDNGLYGYRDRNDKIVIEASWKEAECFFEGAAVVGKYDEFGELKYGFIDEGGRLIVPLVFSRKPDGFSDGLARVYSKNGPAYVDGQGQITLDSEHTGPELNYFGAFHHGYSFSNTKVLDKQGKIISAKDFLVGFGIPSDKIYKSGICSWDVKNIYSGKMMVSFKGNDGHMYKMYHALLDLIHKKVLFLWYADASIGAFDPTSGLALVREYGEKIRNDSKRIGYMNEEGVFVIVQGEASKW